ncbi:MAG: RES family NAD+ phosphorylase [Gammaproteobacteria bacterium]|nr:RES family NAD+ phosphorylase [Gammaproteobacteria bacterium]MDX5374819.1 RES family NAD+ phosphorylase [Gammaproteobacteria bacterium]
MDLWAACGLKERIHPLRGEFWRIVESQEQVATTRLVDNLAEQALLEALLEGVKPAPRAGSERLDYLLMTPFRYPPLRHGSRFGQAFEPSLLYGALAPATALAECAYYRFVFRAGMAEPPPDPINTRHTLFRAGYATKQGLRLQQAPCERFRDTLADPADYRATQALGSAMRAAGVIAFEYPSARDPERGANVALFEPSGLYGRRPRERQEWLCELTAEQVTFLHPPTRQTQVFPRVVFEVEGRLPQPAV